MEKPNILPTEQRYPQHGDRVLVAQKIHYESGELTEGIVENVLTCARFHPRGHKVRLTNGIIGRVQKFVDGKTTLPTPTAPIASDNDPGALV